MALFKVPCYGVILPTERTPSFYKLSFFIKRRVVSLFGSDSNRQLLDVISNTRSVVSFFIYSFATQVTLPGTSTDQTEISGYQLIKVTLTKLSILMYHHQFSLS